jgi:hypothetical protein
MNKKLALVLKGFLGLILYFGISLFSNVPFLLLGADINSIPVIIKETYLVLCDVLVIAIIILLFKDQIKSSFEDLKKKSFKTFHKIL